jgi:hypothetical protein
MFMLAYRRRHRRALAEQPLPAAAVGALPRRGPA